MKSKDKRPQIVRSVRRYKIRRPNASVRQQKIRAACKSDTDILTGSLPNNRTSAAKGESVPPKQKTTSRTGSKSLPATTYRDKRTRTSGAGRCTSLPATKIKTKVICSESKM